ncbi:MAG: hypothetical protein IV100_08155 [Myxococcales bacterium]|nr:hypothetical protein [Myxococcales bacterium]
MHYRFVTLGLLAVTALVFAGTGCLSTTDFQSKAGRVTDLSAYSLDAWEMRTGLGLVGTTLEDVGANIPLEIGLPGNVQLGTNVAHDIGTLLNLNAKWTALDFAHFGLAVEVGVKWTNPSLMYFLPQDIRDDYGDINLILLPMRLDMSVPILSWMDAHLDVGYLHSGIVGDVETEVDAGVSLSYRELFLDARLGFYPAGKVAIFLGAYIPVFARANIYTGGEYEAEPGVYVGATARAYEKVDVRGLNTFYLQTEMRWGATHLRIGIVQYLRYLDKRIEYPLPTLDLFWRF